MVKNENDLKVVKILLTEIQVKNLINNLKKNINITKDQIRIMLIGQNEILKNYKYECKSVILLLNLK